MGRLLILEHDVSVVDVLISEITNQAVRPCVTRCPRTACCLAEHWRPHTVLLDVSRKVFDGFDVANRIRKMDPNVHLIAHGDSHSAKDREQAVESGFDIVVDRPARSREIEDLAQLKVFKGLLLVPLEKLQKRYQIMRKLDIIPDKRRVNLLRSQKTKLLSNRSLSEPASSLLLSLKDELLSEWLDRVGDAIESTKLQPPDAVMKIFPQFLDAVVRELQTDTVENRCELRRFARAHATLRAKIPGYSVDDIAAEHRIFSSVVFETLQRHKEILPEEMHALFTIMGDVTLEAAHELNSAKYSQEAESLEFSQAECDKLSNERDRIKFFIASIVHDLKQPLNTAGLWLDCLVKSPERKEFVDKAQDNLKRICGMLNDMLDSFRIGSGEHLSVDLDCVDWPGFLQGIADDYQLLHGDRFELKNLFNDKVIIDQKQFRRAIENLLNNAFKYGDRNSKVTLSSEMLCDNMELSVHNYGNPIKEADMALLFSPYYRAPKNGDRKEGWGLGLPLVKDIVESHGGEISVLSALVDGTTFRIRIPVKKFR